MPIGRLQKVKTKEKIIFLAIEVVAVTYNRWSLTRGTFQI